MTVPTRAVHVDVHEADGTAIQGAVVTAKLTGRDTYQDQVVDRVVETVTTDVNGEATLNLFPNVLGERNTAYLFTIRHPTTNRVILKGVARVPDTDCELTDILGNTTQSASQTMAEAYIKNLIAPGLIAKVGNDQYAIKTLEGTANQVSVANGDASGSGNIVLSLPQDIHTGASPTFNALTLTATLALGGALTVGGQFLAASGAVASPSYAFTAEPSLGFYRGNSGQVYFGSGGVSPMARFGSNFSEFAGQVIISSAVGNNEVRLFAEATNTLGLRNGANAQSLSVYNTFTDASNYERLQIRFSGNVAEIFTRNAGTGVNRTLAVGTAGAGQLQFYGQNALQFNVSPTPSAVNFWQASGQATANIPGLIATGSDTNVGGAISSKGSGSVDIQTGTFSLTQVRVAHNATAVNYIQMSGNITGGFPRYDIEGSDTNVAGNFIGKGTGGFNFYSGDPSPVLGFQVLHTASGVNNWTAAPAVTTGRPQLAILGSDTNVSAQIKSKGSGFIEFLGHSSTVTFQAVPNGSSDVNYFQVWSVPAGSPPQIRVVGSDANIGFNFFGKGSGPFDFFTNTDVSSARQVQFVHVASAVNYVRLNGAVTSSGASVTVVGSDSNVSMNLNTQGSGQYNFNTGGGNQMTIVDVVSAVNRMQFNGNTTGNGPIMRATGSDTNVQVLTYTKGNAAWLVRTNDGAQTQLQVTHTASAVNFAQMTGGATGAAPTIGVSGSDTDVVLWLHSKGSGRIAMATGGGGEQFKVAHVATAVNVVSAQGSATGAEPRLFADGTDSNVALDFSSKGTDPLRFYTNGNSQLQLQITHTASAVNFVQITGAVTGGNVQISAQGSDANVGLVLSGKGTGDVLVDDNLVVTGATMVQNSQSAAYTTVASDANKHILHPTADNNPRTFTIAANASVAYAIGTCITFVNQINTVTIAINTDTLVLAGAGTTGSRTLAANGVATAVKIASTTWIISGTGLT